MKRVQISAPDWWVREVKRKATEAGLSVSSLIRHTVQLAWHLEPPADDQDDTDEGGEDDN